MPETSDQQRLARVLAQHARATIAMGIDCLPVGRLAGMDTGHQPAPASPSESTLIEPKPVTRGAETGPVVEAAAARSTPPSPPPAASGAEPMLMPARPAPAPTHSAGKRGGAPGGARPPVGEDRDAAQAALDDLRRRYETDAPHAAFNTEFTNIVFGEGDPRARLMFVGEAPGADEDRTGRPFVGRAGQLLDKMITSLGLKREQVYIANVLKTRPPNNATPTSDECAACAPYLYEQIAIVGPEVIVTLGAPATRTLLNTTEAMGKLRGEWAEFRTPDLPGRPTRTIPVMPTYHPAFLLRAYTRENRQKVWSDLLKAAERLGLEVPKKAAGDGAGE
jgi:DNA polymerase